MLLEHLSRWQTARACFSLKIVAIYVVALIMFIFKQWGKKFAMNRQRHEIKERVPISAINLAYESDVELRRLASASIKGMSVQISNSLIDQETNRSALNAGDEDNVSEGRASSKSGKRAHETRADCKCRNCRALSNLTECGVCFESLQSNQIKACPVCANVVCVSCAVRLSSCAFCRSTLPPERNRALERLVDRLILPCKHSKSGCKILLDGESRFIHESICNFAPICCPVGRGICAWHGTVASVQSHLQAVHNLLPLRDHGISVEIHSFRSKAKANDGRVYTVCLSCYDQLFVIRVVLHQNRLRLCFTRLGHATAQPVISRPARYGVSVIIRAHAGRRLRGLVPFGKYDRASRDVNVNIDNLYPRDDQVVSPPPPGCPHRRKECEEDLVKIDMLVKRIEEP
ncbi:uncharacterized protein LOC100680278 [Nasonia vitripennis]|uniref:RING-type E3 ubiquitin transferase n=1 Tax=Nasonia vitripennis TaxID=7425 RepID=A0A7M7GB24_NASVI|nr:uncharacterized protein LOC100680278 [Nasonia vitripennis]